MTCSVADEQWPIEPTKQKLIFFCSFSDFTPIERIETLTISITLLYIVWLRLPESIHCHTKKFLLQSKCSTVPVVVVNPKCVQCGSKPNRIESTKNCRRVVVVVRVFCFYPEKIKKIKKNKKLWGATGATR